MSEDSARLIVDASTLVRWSGPPVGIVRVEAELVRWALDNDPSAVISVYDTRCDAFRPLDPAVARALIAGTAVVETSLMPDPRPIGRPGAGAFMRKLGRMAQPLLKAPRTLACAADEWRRTPGAPGWAATLADALLDKRLRSRAFAKDGSRRDLYRLDTALGPPLRLTPRDTMLSGGLDWNYKDAAKLTALKARNPFRLAMMLYDIIPIVHPRFYAPRDIDVFTRYFKEALGHVDRFVSISRRTSDDLIAFARAQGLAAPDIRDEKLGADAGAHGGPSSAKLPSGLESGRYVLFVSTVEPRKNHALLLRVWKRLAAGEAGGTNGFKLVFAGRRGWMTDDVFAALARDETFKRDVVHVAGATDDELRALYEGAAFCVYPSLYEGFGLPVIEAFMHGKPVIASNGGAVPEAAGRLAPCLDPNDDDAWVATLGRSINDPSLMMEQARRIRAEFSWPTWSQAVSRIVAVAKER